MCRDKSQEQRYVSRVAFILATHGCKWPIGLSRREAGFVFFGVCSKYLLQLSHSMRLVRAQESTTSATCSTAHVISLLPIHAATAKVSMAVLLVKSWQTLPWGLQMCTCASTAMSQQVVGLSLSFTWLWIAMPSLRGVSSLLLLPWHSARCSRARVLFSLDIVE